MQHLPVTPLKGGQVSILSKPQQHKGPVTERLRPFDRGDVSRQAFRALRNPVFQTQERGLEVAIADGGCDDTDRQCFRPCGGPDRQINRCDYRAAGPGVVDESVN